MKRTAWQVLAITGALLLSGCAEVGVGSGSQRSSGEHVDQACADLEAGLLAASSVFNETLGSLRAPSTSDAVPFFGAMGDIVQITLGAMLDPNLGTELSEAVQEMSSASLAVQGLLTQRPPQHLKAQETIKPAVTQLAVACFRSELQYANGGDLFLSSVEPEQPNVIDYSLQNAADPEITLERLMLRGLEAQGIISCDSMTGPSFEKPVDAPIASAMLITVCSRTTGGIIAIYRYEDSLDEAAHIFSLNEIAADIDNYWLLNASGLSMANFGGTELPVELIAEIFDLKRVG